MAANCAFGKAAQFYSGSLKGPPGASGANAVYDDLLSKLGKDTGIAFTLP